MAPTVDSAQFLVAAFSIPMMILVKQLNEFRGIADRGYNIFGGTTCFRDEWKFEYLECRGLSDAYRMTSNQQ
jgi:hypothetical protein